MLAMSTVYKCIDSKTYHLDDSGYSSPLYVEGHIDDHSGQEGRERDEDHVDAIKYT